MGPEGAARLAGLLLLVATAAGHLGVQPLSRIAIHRARVALDASAAVRASPALLGAKRFNKSAACWRRLHFAEKQGIWPLSTTRGAEEAPLAVAEPRSEEEAAAVEWEEEDAIFERKGQTLSVDVVEVKGQALLVGRWWISGRGRRVVRQCGEAVGLVKFLLYEKRSLTMFSTQGEDTAWVTVDFVAPNPSGDDWIGIFSPSNFNCCTFLQCIHMPWFSWIRPRSCHMLSTNKGLDETMSNLDILLMNKRLKSFMFVSVPICKLLIRLRQVWKRNTEVSADKPATRLFICIAHRWTLKCLLLDKIYLMLPFDGKSLTLTLSVSLQPKLIAVSNAIAFANPKAPVYPRLAQGKSWNEMTVTWTSGYDITEAYPFVEWGMKWRPAVSTAAVTVTFDRETICGMTTIKYSI
nr:unnamed protein product [Digitaria exilis]